MVEDSDSYEEDEVAEKQESDPSPPPAPLGSELPPPPPAGFAPPPPPAGFPTLELPDLDESQTSEQDRPIDHEAARRMLLGLDDEENSGDSIQEKTEDDDHLGEPEADQDSFESEDRMSENEEEESDNHEDREEEETEQDDAPPPPPIGFDAPPPPPIGFDAPPPPPGFLGEPEQEQDVDDFSSIDSLADSLSLLEDDFDVEGANNQTEISQSFEIQAQPEQIQWPDDDKQDSQPISEMSQAINAFGLVKESEFTPVKPTRPSPFLRTSSEVDSIPGDKLHATLSETETSVLNPDGTIRKQLIDGELILRNSSKKHRAWDIRFILNQLTRPISETRFLR